jgi:type I restriction enzyme S subunit
MEINKLQNNIPKNWTTIKVEELFDFIGTYSHSKEKMSYGESEHDSVFNIHYGDIHTKYSTYVEFDKDTVPFLIDDSETINNNKLLKDGDLIIADASEDYEGVCDSVELVNMKDKKCIAGLHTFALRDKLNKTTKGYRALLFKNPIAHNWLMRVSTYSKVYGVTKSSLEKTNLILPPISEQSCIVSILKAWDKSIEKLHNKIEIKKQIKKGLEQELLTGKKRVPGFSDKWQKEKLRDIVNFWNGKGHEKDITEKGFVVVNSKFVSSSGRVRKFSDKQISPLRKGDVVMVMSDVPNGKAIAKTFLIDKDNFYTLNQRIGGFNSEKIISYLLSKLLNRDKYFLSFDDGVKQTNLRKDDILEFQIIFPDNLEEQKAITSILYASEEEIANLEKKLTLYQKQKKYLLNNLVTGQIRTPENLLETINQK